MSDSSITKYLVLLLALVVVFSLSYLLGRSHQLALCGTTHNHYTDSRSSGYNVMVVSSPSDSSKDEGVAYTGTSPPPAPCPSEIMTPLNSFSSPSETIILDTCTVGLKTVESSLFLYSNDISESISGLAQFGSFTTVEAKRQAVNDIVFNTLHHPPSPSKIEYVLIDRPYPSPLSLPYQRHNNISLKGNIYEDYCASIVATKSGSRITHTNKCLAVVKVFAGQEYMHGVSHRIGSSPGLQKNLSNRYQDDHIDEYGFQEEFVFLHPLLVNRDELVRNLTNIVLETHPTLTKDPKANSYDKTLVVMVANTGVIDLLINFACSLKKANPSLSHLLKSMLVFVTDLKMASVVAQLEMMPFHCGDSCSTKPGAWASKAAANYGDGVFGKLMWFKTVSVYLPLSAGFNVLFQDVDMVWMRDPIIFLERFNKGLDTAEFDADSPALGNTDTATTTSSTSSSSGLGLDAEPDPIKFFDMTFMDDGSRTPRFSPLFVNSGFYFMRRSANSIFFMEKMLKASGEITQTHSHQATMTRHLSEVLEISTMKINVLDRKMFPSGSMFHHDKTYIDNMMKRRIHPYVFHMCWTASRDEKVKYLREMDMWHIHDSINMTDILIDSSVLERMDGSMLCK